MLFEYLMIGSFCCAVGVRLIQHIRRKTCADRCERSTLFTMGIGFIIGMIGNCCCGDQWSAMLYCIGAYLTYVTLLFSWPSKNSEQGKEVGDCDERLNSWKA